ncbi:MAG: type II secretion system F family protein [Gammaproteobacteria bacterium]
MNPLMIVIGLSALLAVVAVILFLRAGAREHDEEIQVRLRAAGADESLEPGAYRSPRQQIRNPLLAAVCQLLWRSGVDAEPSVVSRFLWLAILLVPVLILVLGSVAGLGVIGIGAVLFWAILSRRAAARRTLIMEQLPAFLEGMMRVLTAGNTLEESIVATAQESPEPLQPLMLSVGRQVRLGAPVELVLMETGEIHQIRDIKVMALAASINRKYGGSMRNILKSLIQAIRARDVAARELRALTAETRFSAIILSILPVGLSIYVYLQNPGYYTEIIADPTGKTMLLVSLSMQILGILVLIKMMRSTGEAP